MAKKAGSAPCTGGGERGGGERLEPNPATRGGHESHKPQTHTDAHHTDTQAQPQGRDTITPSMGDGMAKNQQNQTTTFFKQDKKAVGAEVVRLSCSLPSNNTTQSGAEVVRPSYPQHVQ